VFSKVYLLCRAEYHLDIEIVGVYANKEQAERVAAEQTDSAEYWVDERDVIYPPTTSPSGESS
jgi:hypothetical protein